MQDEGSKVKRVLAEQGRTAAWLAKQLGIHRTTLEQIESTNQQWHRDPPALYYERIAGILNVPISAVKPDERQLVSA